MILTSCSTIQKEEGSYISKYTVIETEFKDPDCLVQALIEIGYTATKQHEKAQHLVGYLGDTRDQTAEIVIPRATKGGLGSSSNDLGFKRQANGAYKALISEFDLGQVGRDFIPKLSRTYAEINTKKTALIQGLRFVQKTTNELGEIQLEFAVI